MENSCGNLMLNAGGNGDANSHFKHITCCFEGSTSSIGSTSSSDVLDDASSSSSPSSPEPHLYRFSDTKTTQLPIKKGLSRYYRGKSKTFTSISDVRCVQDLAKKETPFVKRGHRSLHSPKTIISKKKARGFSNSLVVKGFFRPPSA